MSHIRNSHFAGRDLSEVMEIIRGRGNTRLLIESAINHKGGAIILVADWDQKSYVLQSIQDMVGKNHQVDVMTLKEAPRQLLGIQRKPVMIDLHPAAGASEGALRAMAHAQSEAHKAKQEAAKLSHKLHKANDEIEKLTATIIFLRDSLKRVDGAYQELALKVVKARVLLSPRSIKKKTRGVGRKVLKLLGGDF